MDGRYSKWRIAVAVISCLALAFLVLPSLIVIPMSFGDTDQIVFPPREYSLGLFKRLLSEPGWLEAAWLSFWLGLVTTCISLLVGVPAAYALARGNFPGRKFIALYLLSPILVPHAVIALALYVYFVKAGIQQGAVRLILAHVVVTLPFVIVTALTGLRGIDVTLERAATVMGANQLTVLRKVTLPLLKPAIISGGLFSFLISFDEVVISFFVRRAEYTTLPVKMFASIQWEISPVLAAISTVLTILSVFICVAAMLVLRKENA